MIIKTKLTKLIVSILFIYTLFLYESNKLEIRTGYKLIDNDHSQMLVDQNSLVIDFDICDLDFNDEFIFIIRFPEIEEDGMLRYSGSEEYIVIDYISKSMKKFYKKEEFISYSEMLGVKLSINVKFSPYSKNRSCSISID